MVGMRVPSATFMEDAKEPTVQARVLMALFMLATDMASYITKRSNEVVLQ